MGVRMLKLLLGAVTAQGKKTHQEYRPTVVSATQPKQRHWFVDAVGFCMYLAENEQLGASYWDFGALQVLIRDVLATLVRAGLVVNLFFDALSEEEPAVAASNASLDAFQAVADDSSSSSTSNGGSSSSSSSASTATTSSPAEARRVKVNRAHKNVDEVKPLGLRRAMLDAIREAVAAHPAQLTLAVTQDEAERELMRELQRSKLGKDQALILSNDSDIFLFRGTSIEHEVVWLHPAESQFMVACSSGEVRYQYVSSASSVAKCLGLEPERLPDLALVLGSNEDTNDQQLFGEYCDKVATQQADLFKLYKRRMAVSSAGPCRAPLCPKLSCIYKHRPEQNPVVPVKFGQWGSTVPPSVQSYPSVSLALASGGRLSWDFMIALYKAIVADIKQNERETFLAIARRRGGSAVQRYADDLSKRYDPEPPLLSPYTRLSEVAPCVAPLFECTAYLNKELLSGLVQALPPRGDEARLLGAEQALARLLDEARLLGAEQALAHLLGAGVDVIEHERAMLILVCRELLKCASRTDRGELGAIAVLALREPRSLLEPPARIALDFLAYRLCRLLDSAGCSQLRRLGEVAPLTAGTLRELSPLILAGFCVKADSEGGDSEGATAVPLEPTGLPPLVADLHLVGHDAPDDWEALG